MTVNIQNPTPGEEVSVLDASGSIATNGTAVEDGVGAVKVFYYIYAGQASPTVPNYPVDFTKIMTPVGFTWSFESACCADFSAAGVQNTLAVWALFESGCFSVSQVTFVGKPPSSSSSSSSSESMSSSSSSSSSESASSSSSSSSSEGM